LPTPPEIVDELLKLAEVTKDDRVYDLGSGDGRIVIAAAKQFGARGVGIEFDGDLVRRSREEAQADGVDHLAQFRQGDVFQTDFSEATVVTIYLLPEYHLKLRPILQQKLKPGTRIVAHRFDMGDWKPLKTVNVKNKQGEEHQLFLWKIEEPAKP
jgi:ribosomal protein L11 methylase PrmA